MSISNAPRKKTAEQIARELFEERHRWCDCDEAECGGVDERAFIREVIMTLERNEARA
jgi:hypothetical protein